MIYIEKATLKDFKIIAEMMIKLDLKHIINRKEFKKIDKKDRFIFYLKNFKEGRYIISVAKDSLTDSIVGICVGIVSIIKDILYFVDTKIGKILYTYIKKEYRKKSIASELLKHVEDIYRSLNIEKIELQVYSFNIECLHKPLSQGYTEKIIIYEKSI